MSNLNSIPPERGTLREVQEALGITQFPDATSWYQVIGGLILQGGKISVGSSATGTVSLVAPYEKQFLGVFTQVVGAAGNSHYVNNVTLSTFDIVNGVGARDYYWWAIGV